MNDEETRKYMRDYYLRNRDKINARRRARQRDLTKKTYYREGRNAYVRKYRQENLEKIRAKEREYVEKKRKDPEWVKKINAYQLARYHAKKKQEE